MIASSETNIHRTIVDFAESGREFAVATVLEATGSTPREAGTKAVIESDGTIHGTIGGGAVEGETQRRATDAIRRGLPFVFDYELEGRQTKSDEPICGGAMRILIDPTAANHPDAHARALEAEKQRDRGTLLTSVRTSDEPEVEVSWIGDKEEVEDLRFPPPEAVRRAWKRQEPELVRGEGPTEVLIEPLVLPPLLVIAGGGHVGQAVAEQAGLVGFAVTVIDDRPEFTDSALFPPDVNTRCGDISNELAEIPFGDDVYVVIVTRGHQHDRAALAACIHETCAYVGMIGSRRKVTMIRRDMLDSGDATEAELDRVYAPIGLDIGAETVPEIATSIVSQLIAVRRKGTAPRIPLEQ